LETKVAKIIRCTTIRLVGAVLPLLIFSVGAVTVAVGLWMILAYNALIGRWHSVVREWSALAVLFNRRHELAALLLEANPIDPSAAESFGTLLSAQTRALAASSPGEFLGIEQKFGAALRNLLPFLQNSPRAQLLPELQDTERSIRSAQVSYNQAVTRLNARLHLPWIAGVAHTFGFAPQPYVEPDVPA